ncbi:MAG: ABC transporter substrate-binding protein [Promethearchaeota archaeon]
MEMEKKNLAIIILAVVLAASGVGNVILGIMAGVIEEPGEKDTLIFASIAGPTDMDPHLCYDTAGGDVISQVCEGLYKLDVTDPTYPLIPWLATDLPTVEGTAEKPELVIHLRQGVNFTDGTPFNAAAVKWNFDRLNYFLNVSGNAGLPAPFNIPLSSSVYFGVTKVFILFTLGGERVINETVVEDAYTVRIKMNMAKASFVNLLNFHTAFFHSPTSAQAQGKELDYLTYADGDVLIGTGPFILDYYTTDVEVKFHANPNYWLTPANCETKVKNLVIWIIEDDIAINTAILAGDIDLYDAPLEEFFDQFIADPDITFVDAGPTLSFDYMGFNGYMVNVTWRKAISYAVNYSYVIDVIRLGNGYRLKSPIPEGIPMSNYSFDYPVFDRAYARSIVQSMGFGVGFTTDQEWLDQAAAGGWPGTEHWNITAQTEGVRRRDIGLYFSDNLEFIGIDAPLVQISFWDIITCTETVSGPLRRDQIPMYIIGWAPDYIDPENMITPLYSNRTTGWVNTYDYELEVLMLEGETTVDPDERQAIYNQIQQKLLEELYFFVWIETGANKDVYQSYVKGWVPNAIARLDLYPVYFEF